MRKVSVRFLGLFVILAATLAGSRFAERTRPEALATPLSTIPKEIAGWKNTAEESLSDGVLGTLKPTSYLARTYQKKGQQLGLFIAYYAQQRAGESMHSPKHCLPGAGWEIWDYGSAMVPVNGGQVKINRYSIQNAGARSVVLYWYQSRNRVIASEYLGRLLLIRDALVEGKAAGSIVRIVVADQPGAVNEGVRFAAEVIPQFQRCMVF